MLMKKVLEVLGLICLIQMLFIVISEAATFTATSCDKAAVDTAIARATDGDTVVIPSGSCIWTACSTVTKGITIQGTGVDSTVLTNTTAGSCVFTMNVSSPKTWKITGITFRGGGSGSYDAGLITTKGSATGWQITGNNFSDFVSGSRAITVTSSLGEGLIDNNLFTSSVRGGNIDIRGTDSSNDNGCAQWNIPLTFGASSTVVFIEDNQWIGNFDPNNDDDYFWVTDGYFGGHFVFRYNYVKNYNLTWHGCDSSCRGFISAEIYNNTFTNDKASGHAIGRVMSHRSGTALIYNNTVTGRWTAFSTAYPYRDKVGTNKSWMGDPWSYCDGRPLKFCAAARGKPCYTDADCTWGTGPCSKKVCSGDRDLQCTSDSDCIEYGTCSEYLDGRTVVRGTGMTGTASCGPCSTTFLTVSGTPWTTDALVNDVVWNSTAGSWCKITSNSTNTLTCSTGLRYDNYTNAPAWQNGDSYFITDGYPCRDQPGAGPGGQVSQPFYGWNNSYCQTGPSCTPVVNAGLIVGGGPTIENRDYFNCPSYADCASKGLRNYQPYPYPHPPRSSGNTGVPSPPSNLRITQ